MGREQPRGRGRDAIRLELEDGSVVWPVQRVMKRYERGPEESLTAWGASLGVTGARG